jgi:hypothetical protein
MSTRSGIGIIYIDGRLKATYCHHDGYVEGVGLTLLEHYRDQRNVEALVDIGGFSSLEETVEETAKYAYTARGEDKDFRGDGTMLGYPCIRLQDTDQEYHYIYNTIDQAWSFISYPHRRIRMMDLRCLETFVFNKVEQKTLNHYPIVLMCKTLYLLKKCQYQEYSTHFSSNEGIELLVKEVENCRDLMSEKLYKGKQYYDIIFMKIQDCLRLTASLVTLFENPDLYKWKHGDKFNVNQYFSTVSHLLSSCQAKVFDIINCKGSTPKYNGYEDAEDTLEDSEDNEDSGDKSSCDLDVDSSGFLTEKDMVRSIMGAFNNNENKE